MVGLAVAAYSSGGRPGRREEVPGKDMRIKREYITMPL